MGSSLYNHIFTPLWYAVVKVELDLLYSSVRYICLSNIKSNKKVVFFYYLKHDPRLKFTIIREEKSKIQILTFY